MLRPLRTLGRSPGFTASTILTLALGAGANTGAFSALHALLLKQLPYPEPDRLVTLYETATDRKPHDVSEANLMDWEKRSTLFDAMAAFRPRSFGLTWNDAGAVTVIQTGMVTAGFFRSVGVAPALGREFTREEEATDTPLLVLTDRMWRAQFGADPSVAGRRVFLNEEAFTVIGVMPPGFEYPMDLVLPDAFRLLSRRDYCCARSGSLGAVARLKRGISMDAARAELEAIGAQLALEFPATNRGRSVGLRSLAETLTGGRREALMLLVGAAALLLAIACANVAGMMVARGLAQRHEMAIRASLGAGAWQMARPFLGEALVLAAGGALCGLPAAQAVLRLVPRFIAGANLAGPLDLDAVSLVIALGITALLTLLLACAPVLVLRRADLRGLIQAGGRGGARLSRSWTRSGLVVAQVALSVVLLLSAGLLMHSFFRLLATSPGFTTAHALRFAVGLPEKRYDTDAKLAGFHHDLLDRLNGIPGVAIAGAAARLPLRGGAPGGGAPFQIASSALPPLQRPRALLNVASPEYFAAMGIPLLAGREFSWRDDRPQVRRVAIVNQAFARAFLKNRHILGTLLELHWVSEWNPPDSTWEIAGVVGDTRQANLDREAAPEIFLSMTQVACDTGFYVIRAQRDDPALAKALAAAVSAQDPRVERVKVLPMQVLVDRNLGSRSGAIELVGAFALLALVLTAIGVYGIVSFRAAERSHEMAIRMALGATGAQVRGLIVRHGMRLTVAGTALGIAAFALVLPLVRSQLYGVAAFDPLSVAIVAGCTGAVALAACAIPGARAARQTPMALLRSE